MDGMAEWQSPKLGYCCPYAMFITYLVLLNYNINYLGA